MSAPTLTPTGNGQAPSPPIPVFDNSPTFKMACQQLDTVAGVIDIDPGVLKRLAFPRRALVVSRQRNYDLTAEGRRVFEALVAVRRATLDDLVRDWSPDDHQQLSGVLDRLARSLASEMPSRA